MKSLFKHLSEVAQTRRKKRFSTDKKNQQINGVTWHESRSEQVQKLCGYICKKEFSARYFPKLSRKQLVFSSLLMPFFLLSPLFTPKAQAVSIELNGTRTILSGADCGIATYRFGTNSNFEGKQLDLLVEVLAEDNEYSAGQCIGISSNLLSIRINDEDRNNDVGSMDLKITVVERGTTTPVEVDRLTVAGLDLDINSGGGTATDDVYLKIPDSVYLSSDSQVTYVPGSFFGGEYQAKLLGTNSGNCNDTAAAIDPTCRGGSVYINGTNGVNKVSSITVRLQNDNAYGQNSNRFAHRLFQLSFEMDDFNPIVTSNTDYGDAPSSYGNAGHSVDANITLGFGNVPDNESGTQASANADGDDTDSITVDFDDEEGVQLNGQPLDAQSLDADATTNLDVTTFGTGYLSAWIDLDGDGSFSGVQEQVVDDIFINSNTVETTSVPIAIPASATGGDSYIRFRFSAIQEVGSSGFSNSDGEVEDYKITIVTSNNVSGTVYEDFGAGGNNNNTFDNNEGTIGDVTVNLFADANNDGQPDSSTPVKTIETDSTTGAYQFTDVSSGRYVIQVDTRDTDIPSTHAIGTPNPIQINVTSDITNQDFGFNTVSKTCPAGSFLPEQTFLNFQNPQLQSGNALSVGAVYRFPNVATDIDALVEIKSFNNATLAAIDRNDFGVQSAFQPEIRANSENAGEYSVDFDIQFVQSGTTTPVELRKILATGIDIDGDNVQVREASELGGNRFTSYAIDSESRLTATELSPTRVKFESTTTFNQPSITINSLNQGSAFYDKNTQKIEYRAGLIIDPGNANNIANQRLTSLVFDCVEYNQAVVNQEYKISGTVYEDFGAGGNNNNTFDNGEGTIGNVTVDLFEDANNDNQPDGAAIKTIETDAATGAYEFTEVTPGRYLIRVNTRDTDIPDTHAIGTPNPIQINVSSSDITNQDFGFNTVSKSCPAGSFLPEQTFLDFQNPQLESGNALSVGAVYRFPNVATDIDALVEVKSFNNATLAQIDRGDFGVQSAFQPEVSANSTNIGEYSVDFDIQFVQSGTDTPVEMRKILATGIDIDGDNVRVREASELGGNRFTSYAIDSNSNLTATELSSTRVKFESRTTFNQPNITINSLNQGSAFYDSSVQKIEYRAGLIIDPGNATNIANQRLTSLVFDCVEYNLAVTNNPNVILVKRITAINGNRNQNPNDGTVLNQFVDDTSSPQQGNDNSPNWPDNYLLGAIDAGKVKPEDEIEYTVYFLNIGNGDAADVRLCDRITNNQDFQPDAYATGRGIQLQLGNSAQTNLTNANDNGDRAQLIASGGAVPANCNLQGVNTNGTVQIDITGNTGSPSLTTMPGSTGKGTPNNSYGLFRFTTKVQP